MVKLLLTDNAFPTDKQLKRDIFLSCCGSTDNVLEEKRDQTRYPPVNSVVVETFTGGMDYRRLYFN